MPNNEQVQKLVTDTEQRIMAMALVHQKLYQSRDLSRIPMQKYIHELAALLVRNATASTHNISLVFEVEPVSLLIDTAIPCDLILNELLSNALKYAFPGNQQGTITIHMFRNDADRVVLSCADNGIGVPPEFDVQGQTILGPQTVFASAEHQMQGKVRFSSEQGVTWAIEFPDTLYTERV